MATILRPSFSEVPPTECHFAGYCARICLLADAIATGESTRLLPDTQGKSTEEIAHILEQDLARKESVWGDSCPPCDVPDALARTSTENP